MAVFSRDDFQRLDYQLLQAGSITLYHKQSILVEDVDWLRREGYVVHPFHCARWTSIESFHDSVESELPFPVWYGRNLDAFSDCLGTMPVLDSGGVVLVWLQFDAFARRFSIASVHVLDVLEESSRSHLLFGRRMISVVQSDDPEIELPAFGATCARWNRKEHLVKDRL